jgi:hypothetical protein
MASIGEEVAMAHGMTAVRQDPFARLDAWVLEELEALGRPRAPERAKRRAEPERARFDDTAVLEREALDEGPLPIDEGQFVQRVTEWLQGRPNADLILEEIWRNVVTPESLEDLGGDDLGEENPVLRADDADDADGDEALAESEPPEGPADAADEAPPASQA